MKQDEMIELAKQANFEWLTPDVRTLILLVAAKEREACAKICDDDINGFAGAYYLANKIRARGQA
jgi:hypothetical protein